MRLQKVMKLTMSKSLAIVLLFVIAAVFVLMCVKWCCKPEPVHVPQSKERTEAMAKIHELKQRPAEIETAARIKKNQAFSRLVKDKIEEVVKTVPGVTKTSDSTFTAGAELADTLAGLRIDLKAANEKNAVKDTIINEQGKVIAMDSVTIQSQQATINKQGKSITFWKGAAIGLAATITVIIAVVTLAN